MCNFLANSINYYDYNINKKNDKMKATPLDIKQGEILLQAKQISENVNGFIEYARQNGIDLSVIFIDRKIIIIPTIENIEGKTFYELVPKGN